MQIKKAVFPVAGLGTRFLPATKATPKEMLPIVDKPLIQYAVEEAIEAGITQLIFVTSSSKNAIENHFDSNFELEYTLKSKGKLDWLKIVKEVLPPQVSVTYVRQPEALGLGHAVLCAAPIVGNEPFAVLLADDLIMPHPQQPPCLKQMIDLFDNLQQTILACQTVNPDETEKYGIVKIGSETLQAGEFSAIQQIVEKPKQKEAPSNIASIGRYILTPEIFPLIATVSKGAGGEIQLVDGIEQLISLQQVYAYCFHGKRYDCGSKLGYLQATIEFGIKHPELGVPFLTYLKNIATSLPA